MKVTLKTPVYEATQWNLPGDHPLVQDLDLRTLGSINYTFREAVESILINKEEKHGVLRLGLSGYQIVYPGDWIIEVKGSTPYALSDKDFKEKYVEVK